MSNLITFTLPPGTFCLKCEQEVKRVHTDQDLQEGDLLQCDGCSAVHKIVPDGLELVND